MVLIAFHACAEPLPHTFTVSCDNLPLVRGTTLRKQAQDALQFYSHHWATTTLCNAGDLVANNVTRRYHL